MDTNILANLRKVLAELYADLPSIRRVVADSGINSSSIDFDPKAINAWHSVISTASNSNQINALFDVVERDYGSSQEFQYARDAYFQSIDQAKPTILDSNNETNSANVLPKRPKDSSSRIFTVDSEHKHDFSTISAAISAAKAGDKILILPGIYDESLIIDKELEIVGEGEVSNIVVQTLDRDVLLFKTTRGQVRNLTLKQVGTGRWYAVDIQQGELILQGCNITSKSLACVAVHNGSNPIIQNNHIHSGAASGILIYEQGKGIIKDNHIYAHRKSGLEIGMGSPIVRNNHIYNCGESGIYIYEQGKGLIEGNQIFANAGAGIQIESSANPIVRNNRIYQHKIPAIWITSTGSGVFEDNDFDNNPGGAWNRLWYKKSKVKRSRNQSK